VHVVAPDASVGILAGAEPDVQTCVQPFELPLGAAATALLERADAVVLGPGLGRGAGRREFALAVIGASPRVVLDADGIVAFHGAVPELARAAGTVPLVLTPHLGEFRGLFPEQATGAAVDPWSAAIGAARAIGATVLLKGVPTVVASPEGAAVTIAAGNPGLATGGSGDTLSGLIGTFLAQGLGASDAASLGAQVMGRAADLAAARSSARSLRPMDVIAGCTELWRAWSDGPARLARFTPPVIHELERPRH
jgi:NAD(P)H-hydrate epimerase